MTGTAAWSTGRPPRLAWLALRDGDPARARDRLDSAERLDPAQKHLPERALRTFMRAQIARADGDAAAAAQLARAAIDDYETAGRACAPWAAQLRRWLAGP